VLGEVQMLLDANQGPEPSANNLEGQIAKLSKADHLRLKQAAIHLCKLKNLHPGDLLQEAFFRSLNGARRQNPEVGIVPFLVGVMKSIVSSECKARSRHPEVSLLKPADGAGQEVDHETDLQDEKLTPEQQVISARTEADIKGKVLGLFEDDPVALTVVEGLMEEMEPKEIQELTGLDEKSYATIRRLIRRRINKAFPEGWTHE